MPSKTKENICHFGPIIDVQFRKWFPLFEEFSLRTTMLMSPTNKEQHIVLKWQVSPKHVIREQFLKEEWATCSTNVSPSPLR